ncbi:hypothetical protein BLNAU_20920 [Blattamonas nauphoetae]|uniref:Uncharacterized protein n=1 Tax=Blattamonas nauphoetae TaxID=2049346 RepID=A0ABQ9WXY7_9EUKA|nr:hypothetical protein BLNAU_20920 [Blattamonas nauphoetae]
MLPTQTEPVVFTPGGTNHTSVGLMEEFGRCESGFKNGDETVQFKIAHSVFNILTSGLSHDFNMIGILSSVIGVMVTSVSEGRPRLRSDLIPSLLALSSHADSSLSTPATNSLGLLCGGSLSCVEVEGVLSSGIVERLCTRIESEDENGSESGSVDVVATLVVLDRLCSGLKQVISSNKPASTSEKAKSGGKPQQDELSPISDRFSLVHRCGNAISRIEQAVVTFGRSLEDVENDEKTRILQEKVGGMILRYFSSSIQPLPQKEIGPIGIDLAAGRREMEDKMKLMESEREKEKEKVRRAEEERQREFSRKMREMESEREKEKREMEEMKRMNEKWVEEGRQREEEKKREEERKRKEEEERRRNVKEGAAAIEVFQQDRFTLARNVFTPKEMENYHLLTHSFGAVVVRITCVIRAINYSFYFGLIATNLTELAETYPTWGMGSECMVKFGLYGTSSVCMARFGMYGTSFQ